MKFVRFVFTISGLWTCALALLALVLDGVRSIAANELVMKSLGATWFELDSASLNLTQAVIQRNVHPLVWDPLVQWILTMPAWLVAAVIGAGLIYLGRKRRPKVIRI
ncbi:hypothetical protein [Cohaesibacter celericrescens]|uniref:Uncharacterized protein n=1 Tax=Cohaesibacter celericrescens TaxID=2067669 RepID=A0A2N5XNX0_9HYPH|nr:hypothetical protein [Cohaesibacter celericrescens]PLW76117.1 hypothetical protein C0081_14455 [Cohaesibacter celericrescens]